MTEEDVIKIIKRNMNLQMDVAGIRADFEEALQRPLIGMKIEDEYVRNYLWERGLIAVDEDPKFREE